MSKILNAFMKFRVILEVVNKNYEKGCNLSVQLRSAKIITAIEKFNPMTLCTLEDDLEQCRVIEVRPRRRKCVLIWR